MYSETWYLKGKNLTSLDTSARASIRDVCAMTCDFQQCDILTCVDLDKSVQPPFKHRN